MTATPDRLADNSTHELPMSDELLRRLREAGP